MAVLHGHFQGALDGGGAVIGEKDAFEGVFREKSAEPRGEFGGERVGEAEKRNVRGFFELGADGGGDHRMGVAVDVGPDRRISIEVAPPLGIPQPRALAVGEDQRLVSRARTTRPGG